jgi:Phage integrase, N-terminal SAM-like domain
MDHIRPRAKWHAGAVPSREELGGAGGATSRSSGGRTHAAAPRRLAYVYWVRAFIRFHGVCHPASMGAAEVEAFVGWLAGKRKLSASSGR